MNDAKLKATPNGQSKLKEARDNKKWSQDDLARQ
ncbi:MAG: hypothetical protein RLZZ490_1112, partial [Cyanobacteriota bacterium]